MSFFGKNIKKIRGIKRMSQQAFADIFELKRATLGAYEEGRSEPKIATLIKVANYFSISIDAILTKEITVNELLHFNDAITTDVNQIVKSTLIEVPFVSVLNVLEFKDSFSGVSSYDSLPKLTLPIQERRDCWHLRYKTCIWCLTKKVCILVMLLSVKRLMGDLEEGSVVMVLYKDIFCVRRYTSSKSAHILKADHVHIAPLEVDKHEKVVFWKVCDVLLKRMPNSASKLEDRINKLDAKLAALSNKGEV